MHPQRRHSESRKQARVSELIAAAAGVRDAEPLTRQLAAELAADGWRQDVLDLALASGDAAYSRATGRLFVGQGAGGTLA